MPKISSERDINVFPRKILFVRKFGISSPLPFPVLLPSAMSYTLWKICGRFVKTNGKQNDTVFTTVFSEMRFVSFDMQTTWNWLNVGGILSLIYRTRDTKSFIRATARSPSTNCRTRSHDGSSTRDHLPFENGRGGQFLAHFFGQLLLE